MNYNFQDPRKLMPNLQINHIKVPEFQLNASGTEILKAKKIQVNPVNNQARSLSAQCNFRKVFQIPKASQNKENLERVSTSVSNVKKAEDCGRFRSQCRGATQKSEKKLRGSWFRRGKEGEGKEQALRAVPVIKLLNIGLECIKRVEKKNQDDLITFRPGAGQVRRETRFPRDIFTIEGRKKIVTTTNN